MALVGCVCAVGSLPSSVGDVCVCTRSVLLLCSDRCGRARERLLGRRRGELLCRFCVLPAASWGLSSLPIAHVLVLVSKLSRCSCIVLVLPIASQSTILRPCLCRPLNVLVARSRPRARRS